MSMTGCLSIGVMDAIGALVKVTAALAYDLVLNEMPSQDHAVDQLILLDAVSVLSRVVHCVPFPVFMFQRLL